MDLNQLAEKLFDSKTQEETTAIMENIEAERANLKSEADLNLIGQQWEKEGKTEEAAVLYEINLLNNFDGAFPYDRLAIIYRKQKNKDDEIRVLEKAVYVFENIVSKERPDRNNKLEKYKKDLEKAKSK